MSPYDSKYDVVVIGGGFAGVVAARDLTEQGNTVLLLEAHDHLGGRTWSKTFPGTDFSIEMGGQFIVPEVNPGVVNELERYGVPIEQLPFGSIETITSGGRTSGFPVPLEQIPDLERAAIHLVRAAARLEPGVPMDQLGLADLDIPVSEFLAPLDLPAETYEFVTAVLSMYPARHPEDASAIIPLAFLRMLELSAYALFGTLSQHIRTASLIEPIAAGVTEVRLSCPVVRVDQTGDDVLVTTAGGQVVRASAVVVATPVNVWNDIEFMPQLSEVKRVTSAERHGTEVARKALVRVRNAPPAPSIFAAPRVTGGAFALFTEHEFENGDQLMGIFGIAPGERDDYYLDFNERESVERALKTLLPDAELIEYHTHDYANDPYSKGYHIGWKPGRISKSHSALAGPDGRLTFATGDISLTIMSTIEGAVESGHRAARHTQNHLARERKSALVTARQP